MPAKRKSSQTSDIRTRDCPNSEAKGEPEVVLLLDVACKPRLNLGPAKEAFLSCRPDDDDDDIMQVYVARRQINIRQL